VICLAFVVELSLTDDVPFRISVFDMADGLDSASFTSIASSWQNLVRSIRTQSLDAPTYLAPLR